MKALEAVRILGEWSFETFWMPTLIWTLLALPTYVVVRYGRGVQPQVKYRIAIALLHSLPIGILAAWIVASTGVLQRAPEIVYVASVLPGFTISADPGTADAFRWYAGHTAGTALLVLCLLALWRGIRLVSALLQVRRYGRSLPFEASAELMSVARQVSESLGVHRRFSVELTPEEASPLTFGWRRPVIVLPEQALRRPDELRLTLLHELTHIQRNDYALQWAEQIVGALFFGHPLVSLLRREILVLREITCDAEVLIYTRDRAEYARLLGAYAEPTSPRLNFAFGVPLREHHLATRLRAITSLLDFSGAIRSKKTALALAATLSFLAITAIACSDLLVHPRPEADEAPVAAESAEVFVVVEDMPTVIGGLASIQNNLVYPESAKNEGIEGRVIVQFTVDEEGRVTNAEVVRALHPDLDAAALAALKTARFEPGRQDGRPVAVKLSLPFTFKLPFPKEVEALPEVEQMPQLIGGLEALTGNVTYPEIARKAGIQGTVIVEFVVDKEGTVRNARVVRGIGAGADEEALRAVREARFTPGMDKGEPVEVMMRLPIRFRLPADSVAEDRIDIYINPEGRVFIEGRQVELSDLTTRPEFVKITAKTLVTLKYPTDAPEDVFKRVMEAIRGWADEITVQPER